MDALYDDTIIDSVNLNLNSSSGQTNSRSKQTPHQQSSQTQTSSATSSSSGYRSNKRHYGRHAVKENTTTSKRSKRLPWNCEVIRDRFTPQPYAVQLVERYLEPYECENVLVLAQDASLKQYLMIAALQLQHQKQVIY